MQSPPPPNQPPYQQPYPYHPPPPPSMPQAQQPPRKRSPVPVVVIILAVLAGALVLCCAVGATAAVLYPSHAQVIPTATTQPVVSMQPVTIPTAPTLGGTVADFQQRYGPATDSSGLMYAATIAGQRVLITLTLDDPSESQDGQQHVAIIAVQVPGDALVTETWNQEIADQIAQTFLPADAQFQHIVTTGKIHDHVYHSATMAETFTADQFTNDLGTAQVPVGTLSYSCQPWPPSAFGLGQCLISIGSYAAP